MQAPGARPAGNRFNAHVPLRRRFRQFGLDVGALREQASAAWCEQRRGQGQEFRQRRECAGGDQGCGGDGGCLDSNGVDPNRGAGLSCGFPQEGGLALVGFHQIEGHAGGDGQDQARKAGAGAEIDRSVRERTLWRCRAAYHGTS